MFYFGLAAGDGKLVMLSLQNKREWQASCQTVLQEVALATDPRLASNALRSEHKQCLRDIILSCFAGLSGDQRVELLAAARARASQG